MISAAEARALSGETVEEKVEKLSATIEKLAKKNGRQCRTSYDHKEDNGLWVHGGYKETDEWKEAVKILREKGFHVEFYYHESQFVDMYTIIKW